MDLTDFSSNYLNNLLAKVSKEQKSVFLLGDFNIPLLNYKFSQSDQWIIGFSCIKLFFALQPTRITSHSKTLIGNIFTNVISLIQYLPI